MLCFHCDLFQYFPLSFRPLIIVSDRTDPGICRRLYAGQILESRFRHRPGIHACILNDLTRISVDIRDLLFLDIDRYSSQCIDHVDQCGKVYRHIMLDVQVKITVQHRDRFLFFSKRIGYIRFIITTVILQKQCISVNRSHPDLFCLPVQACDHDRIAPRSHLLVFFTGIQTKQCNVQITGLIISQFIGNTQFIRIQFFRLQFAHLAGKYADRRQHKEKQHDQYTEQYLLSDRILSFSLPPLLAPAADSFPAFPFPVLCSHSLQPGFLLHPRAVLRSF